MVEIRSGKFERANDPNPWVRGEASYGASHKINISTPIEISRHEITNGQWLACYQAGRCSHKPDNIEEAATSLPVSDVNWHDATEFTEWLSIATGETYRLPTEAEWEYAARGGTSGKFIRGDDPATICAYANHRAADSSADTRNTACADGFPDEASPVGSLEPNGYGLHDMLGNVWEWVEDCWHDADWARRDVYIASYPDQRLLDGSPYIGSEEECATRVMRGGSWRNGSLNGFSPHFRNFDYANQRYPNLGFRVVRDRSQ